MQLESFLAVKYHVGLHNVLMDPRCFFVPGKNALLAEKNFFFSFLCVCVCKGLTSLQAKARKKKPN